VIKLERRDIKMKTLKFKKVIVSTMLAITVGAFLFAGEACAQSYCLRALKEPKVLMCAISSMIIAYTEFGSRQKISKIYRIG
jgi:hypothetical protein